VRIAYVSADFGIPVFGNKGASVHVRELTRALSALGHDVMIVTPRADGERPVGFAVPVCAVPAGESPSGREQRRRRYASVLRMRALPLLRQFRPDAIYERYSLFGSAGALLARDLGVPLVLEVNAPLVDEHARYRGLPDADLAKRVERRVLRAAGRVIAVSPAIARWLRTLGVEGDRLVVLPNAVDPERFRPLHEAGVAVRAALGVERRPVIGFVGTLKPWHDVATLVRALALVDRERPALLVVGDGPGREDLAAEAARTRLETIVTGAVPHERIPAHLAAVDVAVVPYARDDGFYFSPLKLVECLAAARPVAAADVGEIRHCVRPGATGSLYAPGDAAGLAAAIRALLEDRVRAAELGAAGRAHVCAQHTWQANARTVAALARAAREEHA
jgi:glycosyltransferase involved in cell wall biosynthesis